MAKFHITKSGRTEPCGATQRACPLGEANHFDSIQEAARAAVTRGFQTDEPFNADGSISKSAIAGFAQLLSNKPSPWELHGADMYRKYGPEKLRTAFKISAKDVKHFASVVERLDAEASTRQEAVHDQPQGKHITANPDGSTLPKLTPSFTDTRNWLVSKGWDGNGFYRSFTPAGLHKANEVLGTFGLSLDDYNLDNGGSVDFFEDIDGFESSGKAEWRSLPSDVRAAWTNVLKRIAKEKLARGQS